VERPDVKPIKGMKAMHSFVGLPNDEVMLCELSCGCPTCISGGEGELNDPECRNHKGRRPLPRRRKVRLEANAAGETRNAMRAELDVPLDALEGLKKGDMALVDVEKADRMVYQPENHGRYERGWDCRGRYRRAEVAEDPPADVQRLREVRRLSRLPLMKVFWAVEEEAESDYSFSSGEECQDGKGQPVGWKDCKSQRNRVCEKKHYYEVDISRFRLSIKARDTREGRFRLNPDEMEAIDEILDELALAHPFEFGEWPPFLALLIVRSYYLIVFIHLTKGQRFLL